MCQSRSPQNGRCHGVTVITIPGATTATTGGVTTVTAVATATALTGAMTTMEIAIPAVIPLISGIGRKTKSKQKMRASGFSAGSHFFNVILGS